MTFGAGTANRDTDRYRTLTRRVMVLGGIKLGLLSTLVARMYYLQVVQSARYAMLADEWAVRAPELRSAWLD